MRNSEDFPPDCPMRVAQVMGMMNSGGVEAVVMNYYRSIDRLKIQFDFFIDETCSFPQQAEIEQFGGRYYFVPPYHRVIAYIRTLKKLFRQNDYSIVHAHINTVNILPLLAARLAGIPVRICHNHSTANWKEWKKTLLKYLLRPFACVFATDYFACGERAGRWMYKDSRFNVGKVQIMPNAIPTEAFEFDSRARELLRTEISIGPDTFVVGHVGRFTYAKNHAFLLDIFRAFHEEIPDSVLLLVGEGELASAIKDRIQCFHLEDCTRLLGVRKDVNKLYSAMDVFCLPSFYEGFPVVLVEAQANGLPCVISNRIASEAVQSGLTDVLPISKTAYPQWLECMRSSHRRLQSDTSGASGASLSEWSKWLEHFYVNAAARKNKYGRSSVPAGKGGACDRHRG